MKYIKCRYANYCNEVSFVNIDKIVNIVKSDEGFIDVITINKEIFHTDTESMKNPITLEKVAEII